MPDEVTNNTEAAADAEAGSAPLIKENAAHTNNVIADTDGDYQESDVFAWANNLFEYKEELTLELFWINKNNVVYRTKLDPALHKQLQPLFIDNTLDYVLDGAEHGMVVRSYEDGKAEGGVLQRVPWKRVEKLKEVMYWVRSAEEEIELFTDEEHDLKRIKGALVRVTHPKMKEPFYIAKALSGGQMLKGEGTWMVAGKVFKPFQAAALKIPAEAHMLILEQDLYIFNQAKLDRLFSYDARKNSLAERKVREIEEHYKLSFAEGIDLQSAVAGNKALVNKLQKIEIGQLTQEQIIDHAEEIGVELMVDDSGAIIIMNPKDLAKFVNLLNDDYMESALTGERYEIIKKRPLKPADTDMGDGMALK
ncbi:MAG TPA: Kiwa anti-phage protein KwaB-like domain-containing protein [Candidatus Saccharimonadales bacterium]|nr:Kiwa anti-phage protein KwaB-like domain-containing protein [Candidatus Saccharimonadales bacterium]